ncbi:MAG: sigma-70 family RNA polymerase sigma factor [Phaeodactylibacter sp.]|nr:sigma-70 family RNA polymerase sigma factor [Phaeodactylibacter sp.]MCB9053222.1 sigma-70 family RNA polymerase sigma factor [Lewinellaceae bacterium]
MKLKFSIALESIQKSILALMENPLLIKGLRDHDTTTIEYIFTRFFPMIENYVKSNGNGNRQEAEDLFMNALEVIYLKAEDENFELHSAFSSLLFEICKRQWLNILKRRKRTLPIASGQQPEVLEKDFQTAIETAERYQLYREKFRKLSEGCRRVLSLALEGLSMRDIAYKLGFASEGYARKRKFKCKQKLMQLVRMDARYPELMNHGRRRKK